MKFILCYSTEWQTPGSGVITGHWKGGYSRIRCNVNRSLLVSLISEGNNECIVNSYPISMSL